MIHNMIQMNHTWNGSQKYKSSPGKLAVKHAQTLALSHRPNVSNTREKKLKLVPLFNEPPASARYFGEIPDIVEPKYLRKNKKKTDSAPRRQEIKDIISSRRDAHSRYNPANAKSKVSGLRVKPRGGHRTTTGKNMASSLPEIDPPDTATAHQNRVVTSSGLLTQIIQFSPDKRMTTTSQDEFGESSPRLREYLRGEEEVNSWYRRKKGYCTVQLRESIERDRNPKNK